APPFRKVELEIIFGKGISASGSLLDAAINNTIIEKTGSWYSYGSERIGQGRDNARLFLEKNPDIYDKIEKEVRKILFPGPGAGISGPKNVQNQPEPEDSYIREEET
ncbi:MAG TPA: DNA recombination/repair protein RecA, partial [Thermodesulfobacteriota bacterium]|nr:DNA recombination/repair protein RecA [Thermodesulfobacteriota bacterium]